MVGLFFAAQQAASVDQVAGNCLFDTPRSQEIQKLLFVQSPIALSLLEGIEDLGGRREFRDMDVVDPADGPREILKIVFLGKRGKLRGVVQANINEPLHPGVFQLREESLSRLLREPYRENTHSIPAYGHARGCENGTK
jgi:hypothetical protein